MGRKSRCRVLQAINDLPKVMRVPTGQERTLPPEQLIVDLIVNHASRLELLNAFAGRESN
jgi:hypothetical protein